MLPRRSPAGGGARLRAHLARRPRGGAWFGFLVLWQKRAQARITDATEPSDQVDARKQSRALMGSGVFFSFLFYSIFSQAKIPVWRNKVTL
jgi:hypothetical protein